MKVCEICGRVAYYNCAQCGKPICDSHVEKCTRCGGWFCPEHIKRAGGKYVCKKCLSSRVMTYLGVAAILILIAGSTIFVLPKVMDRLEITDGELTFEPDVDGKTVKMVLTLMYENESGSTIEITNVSFRDETIKKLFKMEYLETQKIEKDQKGQLTILFPNIPYEEAGAIKDETCIIYWKKVYKGREESTKFSFSIAEVSPYPVNLLELVCRPDEIREEDTFSVEVEVEVLEKIPKESTPLTLVVEIVENDMVTAPEHERVLEFGRRSYEFEFYAQNKGTVTLEFRVVAKDQTEWGEKKSLQVTIKRRDKVRLSSVKLVDENEEDLEFPLYFSEKGKPRYTHGLTFAVEGTGEQVIVLVYFDVPYNDFDGVVLKSPVNMTMNQLKGQFNEHDGVFIVIKNLEERKEFFLEFKNPTFLEFNYFQETVGVALIKIDEETSPLCDTIRRLTSREIAQSTYDLICSASQGEGYQYCSKEFAITFEKKVVPTPTPPPPLLTPTPTPSPTPSPFLRSPQSIVLSYVSFFIFLVSYLFLRRGGIL